MGARNLVDAVERLTDLVRGELRRREDVRRRERRLLDHGQRPLRRMGTTSYLGAVTGLAARFDRKVPSSMFVQVDDGAAEVACPCGETHLVPRGDLSDAPCGRWFLWDGHSVFVAGSPASEPVAVEPEPEAEG